VLPGKRFTPEEILRIIRRRAWLVAVTFSIGVSAAPLISRFVPVLFRSETLIMVIPQRVPDSYVKSTVTAKMEERLPSISNLILSRSRLERTITDFNLYPGQRAQGIMEDIVQRMRADISVQLEGQDSFRVKYVSADARTAQKVTARLASLYIEENLRDRENLADETNLFLESQLNDAKERLIEHEKKLEAYRRRYAGELPTQLASNLQTIQSTQMQLQSINESTNRTRERRLLVERQIADAQTLSPAAAPPAIAGTDKDASASMTTAQQLEAARAQLEVFKLRFTPDHPDIRTLERTIRDLQTRLEEEARLPLKPASERARDLSPAQLVQQKRLQDLRADLEVIDHQLAASEAEAGRLKQVMAGYQSKVDIVPTRESELVELTRDYGTLQTAYMSLLTKREDSKIAANLERRQIGEQFKILDPASLPEKPFNQTQRIGLIASGAVAGLGLGLLLAGFLEFRDSSLTRDEDVVRVLSLPVLALIPVMASDRERRSRRRRVLAVNLGAGAALVASAAILMVWRLHLLGGI
jgi:polysaccharide chain length determinant protein (PEP-CTERM system associated)